MYNYKVPFSSASRSRNLPDALFINTNLKSPLFAWKTEDTHNTRLPFVEYFGQTTLLDVGYVSQ